MKSVFETRPLHPGVTGLAAPLAGLTEFVFDNLKFAITTVPCETDPNKLFEVINNRGVQLQHPRFSKRDVASLLLQQGENVVYVKEQIGHSSIDVTVDTMAIWYRAETARR